MRFQVEHFGKKSQTSSAWKTLAVIKMKNVRMKKILCLFLAIVSVSCNQGGKQTSNENKKDVNTTSQVEVIKKELNASDIYTTSKPKVALLISYDQNHIPLSQGTGFFISKDSLITNYHVIEGASSVEYKLIGEDNFYRGSEIISASQKHDIAIIKTKQKHDFFKYDSSNTEVIGSKIYTIGNPRGLEGTISEGIISAKREEDYDLIQITAPISPGNSGGPLINEKGSVIGVSTFTITNSQNLNFAVPIKYIKECSKYTYSEKAKTSRKLVDKTAVSISSFKKEWTQYFEFISFKNHTSNFIKSITGVIIYKDLKGEIIDFRIINENILIPPNLAKQAKTRSFDQDMNYVYFKDHTPYTRVSQFKIEFRLLSYEIE